MKKPNKIWFASKFSTNYHYTNVYYVWIRAHTNPLLPLENTLIVFSTRSRHTCNIMLRSFLLIWIKCEQTSTTACLYKFVYFSANYIIWLCVKKFAIHSKGLCYDDDFRFIFLHSLFLSMLRISWRSEINKSCFVYRIFFLFCARLKQEKSKAKISLFGASGNWSAVKWK